VKVGVTGANGRIGSALLERFAQTGTFEPVAICRNAMGAALVDGIGCEVRIGSVSERESARQLLGDCDVVVNCAWAVGPPGEPRRRNEAIVKGICGVPAVKTLVFLSSVAIYGSCIDSTCGTFARPCPDTNYGRLKLRLERFAARAVAPGGKRWAMLRLGHVYGPHQWLSREIIELLEDPSFRLPFDGALPSNALHIDCLAGAVAALVSGGETSETYNVADTPPRTWREVFDWHSAALGLPSAMGMADDASAAWRERFVRRRRRRAMVNGMLDVARLLRELPFDTMIVRDGVGELVQSLMMQAPEPIAYRVKAEHRARVARRYIRALPGRTTQGRPWHCSDAMPGRYLNVSGGMTGLVGDALADLRQWHASTSVPGAPF
jgi:nucleoside-diphosphate-sugar epimerase